MQIITVLLALLAGLGLGWLLARRGAEATRDAFGRLSADALRRNSESLLALAEARLGRAEHDLDRQEESIAAMVEPLKESLRLVQRELATAEQGRMAADAALREHLGGMRLSSEALRIETAQLVTALRAPQVRGRWGELQLERAVEAAGMTEHVDYITQATTTNDEGTVRPDLVVRLTGGKSVVVDAKVAFAGYLEAMEARDEPTRAARLKAHARQLRTHIDDLGGKAYWQRFAPSPEFVVCFVPADAFLDAALREDPGLLEHAFARDVVIATPSTLIALLRTIAYTWRQDALAENAAQVHGLGRDLYNRLAVLGGHLDKLGRSLNSAVTGYNQTVASLEGRVLVTARRMADLGVVDAGRTLRTPDQVSLSARTPQAVEFDAVP